MGGVRQESGLALQVFSRMRGRRRCGGAASKSTNSWSSKTSSGSSAQSELDRAFYSPAVNDNEEPTQYFPLLPAYFEEGLRLDTSVTYLSDHERSQYMLMSNDGGFLVDNMGAVLASETAREAMFVMDTTSSILLAFLNDDQHGRFHHSSLVAGAPVVAAGLIRVCKGRVLSISNDSGHYAPLPSCLQLVLTRLAELGVTTLEDVSLEIVQREPYGKSNSEFSEIPSLAEGPNTRSMPGSRRSPPHQADIPEAKLSEQLPSIRGLPPALSLKASALEWSPRLAYVWIFAWAILTNISTPSMLNVDVAAPLVTGCVTVVFTMGHLVLAAKSPDGNSTAQTLSISLAACIVITAHCAVKVAHAWATEHWETERIIRAAIPASTALMFISMHVCARQKWISPWASFRSSAGVASAVGLLGCVLLRIYVGPNIGYPPFKTSFASAIVTWCEMLAAAVFTGPGMRTRYLEAWTVMNLSHGVLLNTDSDGGSFVVEWRKDEASSNSGSSGAQGGRAGSGGAS